MRFLLVKELVHFVEKRNDSLAKVFISFSGPQVKLATGIAEALANQGIESVLYRGEFDTDTLTSGLVQIFDQKVDFVSQISESLVESDYVICLLSPAYVTSNWCIKEYLISRAAKKHMPVLVEECPVSHLQVTDFLNVVGMGVSEAVDEIMDDFDVWSQEVTLLPLSYNKVYSVVERVRLVFPLFNGGYETERWQRKAYDYLVELLKDENVEVRMYPVYVKNLREAEAVRLQLNADIVAYGFFRDNILHWGFCSKGWMYKSGRIDFSDLQDPPIFQSRESDLLDLNLGIKFALGNFEVARNQIEKADLHFSEALGTGESPSRALQAGVQFVYYMQAQRFLDVGDELTAKSLLLEVVRINDTFAGAWSRLGYAEVRLGNLEEALASLNKAISQDDRDHMALGNRAHVLSMGGMKDLISAEADARRSIELNPLDARVWAVRAFISHQLGQPVLSIEYASRSIELDQTIWVAWRLKGLSNLVLGNYQIAIANLSKAISMCSECLESFLNRSQAFSQLGQWDSVKSDLLEYFRLGGDAEEAHELLKEVESHCQ